VCLVSGTELGERCTPASAPCADVNAQCVSNVCRCRRGFFNRNGFCSKHTHTHTQPFNGPLSGTTQVSRYQKHKTNLDFTDARDSEWQWHQLGRMQVCTSLLTDNHASTPPLSFLQAGCPSCRPTNSVKALKALSNMIECADCFKYDIFDALTFLIFTIITEYYRLSSVL